MTDLRTAAQQALEALESAEVDPHSSDAVYKAITALKAALVEDAMQKFTDVNQELMAALGCDHCNHPLYAAIKCRVCGRVTSAEPPCATRECMPSECPNCASAEMEEKLNNQSVDDAFRILAEANRRAIDYINELEQQINELKRAAPPQCKPLTEEEIKQLLFESAGMTVTFSAVDLSLARAIERAHGIGVDE